MSVLEGFRESVKRKFPEEDYIINEYNGRFTNTTFIHKCKDGTTTEFITSPSNFMKRRNPQCPKCHPNKRAIFGAEEDFKRLLYEKFGEEYSLVTKFKNEKGRTKVIIKHNNCINGGTNLFETEQERILIKGQGCPVCGHIKKGRSRTKNNQEALKENKSSKEKRLLQSGNNFVKELRDFIGEIYDGEIIFDDRELLTNQEIGKKKRKLDIYLPELNIAIELDNLYRHSEKGSGHKCDRNYHLDKTRACQEKGIRLIHIFEDEWVNKPKIVKAKIRHILGLNNKQSIPARKCWVNEIDSIRRNKFLDKYHIQGRDSSNISLGLFTTSPKTGKRLLVAVMSFIKPRKALHGSSKYDYELSRYASTGNYRLIGGFGKLFSYFKENYEWDKIITYADIRWSEGNVYLKNDWKYTHDSKPSYSYIREPYNEREFRFKFRKQKLEILFPELYDETLSEREIMELAGYTRIWDCGNMVFEYER